MTGESETTTGFGLIESWEIVRRTRAGRMVSVTVTLSHPKLQDLTIDPDKPEEWAFIKTYSPYHNLSPRLAYPRVLFTTSTRDRCFAREASPARYACSA